MRIVLDTNVLIAGDPSLSVQRPRRPNLLARGRAAGGIRQGSTCSSRPNPRREPGSRSTRTCHGCTSTWEAAFYNLAGVHAMMGREEEAITALERDFAQSEVVHFPRSLVAGGCFHMDPSPR